MRSIHLLVCLGLASGAALAQSRMTPGDEAALAAVGWFGFGTRPVAGQGSCTATLVAPDLILTAGHCVPSGPEAAKEIGNFTFLAGWAGGRAVAGAKAAEVIRPEPDPARSEPLAMDVVLVRLNRRIAKEEVAPLPLAVEGVEPGGGVTTVGYPFAAPNEAESNEGCPVIQSGDAVLALGCQAEGGYSGGPVLVMEWDGWHLAGVMAAKGRGSDRTGTYAVTVPGDLRDRIDG